MTAAAEPGKSAPRRRGEQTLKSFHEEGAIGKAYDARLLKRLWPFVRPHSAFIVLSLVTLVFMAAINLVRPMLMGDVVAQGEAVPGQRVGIEARRDRRVDALQRVGEPGAEGPAVTVVVVVAQQVVRDGEGAQKFVTIAVTGAATGRAARRIGLTIGNSPLVKTALSAGDPNWGRIVMAVGKAGEPANRDRLAIWFGGIRVAHKGERDPAYDEAAVSAAMKRPEITVKVALGLGKGRDRVLTCDLTKEYVAINGDYRS